MPELTLLLGLLCLAGSLGCEAPKREVPLDHATLNAGLDPKTPASWRWWTTSSLTGWSWRMIETAGGG